MTMKIGERKIMTIYHLPILYCMRYGRCLRIDASRLSPSIKGHVLG